ncbi:hypothetical protein [Subtercola boreus]|uniref:hypothetical protein n=1 Tax=Subtercola boreus TaxID=120213 RepID=UPI0011C02F78|nr:hypothetical protein [Subtercola boreus]
MRLLENGVDPSDREQRCLPMTFHQEARVDEDQDVHDAPVSVFERSDVANAARRSSQRVKKSPYFLHVPMMCKKPLHILSAGSIKTAGNRRR